jgi:hypothetical protein
MNSDTLSTLVTNQEAEGQQTLVRFSDHLPKDIHPSSATRALVTKHTKIVFGEDIDDLFVKVSLPTGWHITATDHSMWSTLRDRHGSPRANIFFRAAFYDRRASITFLPRYYVSIFYVGDSLRCARVFDQATSEPVYVSESVPVHDLETADALGTRCKVWINENFPLHEDPFAYWPE